LSYCISVAPQGISLSRSRRPLRAVDVSAVVGPSGEGSNVVSLTACATD
jgi:hypothetical protein